MSKMPKESAAAEQRRLLAEMMAGEVVEEVAKVKPTAVVAESEIITRSDSPDIATAYQKREFDDASIYGDYADSKGGAEGGGGRDDCDAASKTAGWGPPMANVLVTGLPLGKEARALVKATLKEKFGAFGEVVGVTWGSRKGACFVAMGKPLDASKSIASLNEKPMLFRGFGSKLLKMRLDYDQGFNPPPVLSAAEAWGGTPKGGFKDRETGEEDNVVMPVSFTSREGKKSEQQEQLKEQRFLEDTRCWCSVCNSLEHTAKECSTELPEYHKRVVLGYIPAGQPMNDPRLIFGPLPPEFAAKKEAAEAVITEANRKAADAASAAASAALASALPPAMARKAHPSAQLPAPASGPRASLRDPAKAAAEPSGAFPGEDPGDWVCAGCRNANWARRTTCNRCRQPKDEVAQGGGKGGGRGGGKGGFYQGGVNAGLPSNAVGFLKPPPGMHGHGFGQHPPPGMHEAQGYAGNPPGMGKGVGQWSPQEAPGYGAPPGYQQPKQDYHHQQPAGYGQQAPRYDPAPHYEQPRYEQPRYEQPPPQQQYQQGPSPRQQQYQAPSQHQHQPAPQYEAPPQQQQQQQQQHHQQQPPPQYEAPPQQHQQQQQQLAAAQLAQLQEQLKQLQQQLLQPPVQQAAPVAAAPVLLDGWCTQQDEKGEKYYWNPLTGAAQWDPPLAPVGQAQAAIGPAAMPSAAARGTAAVAPQGGNSGFTSFGQQPAPAYGASPGLVPNAYGAPYVSAAATPQQYSANPMSFGEVTTKFGSSQGAKRPSASESFSAQQGAKKPAQGREPAYPGQPKY